jgi:non-ribosomal peptide synthetase component E (peptide arylation enzyme)
MTHGGLLVDPKRSAEYESRGLWPNRTLANAFDDVVARTPDKLLVVAGSTRWTYRSVATNVDVIARNMANSGIGRGDVISVQLPNWAEFLLVHLAATRVGAITNPLLPIYRANELAYILNFAKTRLAIIPSIFHSFDYVNLYSDLRSKLPHLEDIVVVGTAPPDRPLPPGMKAFEDLLRAPAEPSEQTPNAEATGNDATVLIFTSGTEASPKGVIHSHNTLMYGNVTAAKVLGLSSEEVIWGVSPVTHATGLEWYVRQAIVLGATVVLQEVWDAEAALDLIESERCTFTTAATPFATMLLNSPTLAKRDLSSFRMFLCGGAAIPHALGAAMYERAQCSLIPCWGMSECFAATICRTSDPENKQWGSDGRPMPGSEIAIFDESRTRQLGGDEVGEIATRGPHVCLGYFNDPERTRDALSADGWLFSGDLGTIDREGFLHVEGRKKDIINRGGLKISAAEIEGLLCEYVAVRAVAVVGVPDPLMGEKSCAFVVPAGGTTPTLDDLVSLLRKKGVATYKLPEYLVLLDELPMTPTGKVQKFRLREGWSSGAYLVSSR